MAALAPECDPTTDINPPLSKRSQGGRTHRPPSKPEPRNPGFVLHSKNQNDATSYSDFYDVYTQKEIRSELDKDRKDTRHHSLKSQIKRILQIQPSSTAASMSMHMVVQKTPQGRKYGHIVTGHPYGADANVSIYDVNKVQRTASAATQRTQRRKKSAEDVEREPYAGDLAEKGASKVSGSKQKQIAQGTQDGAKGHKAVKNQVGRNDMLSAQTNIDIPKPYADAPYIPSPRKSVLNADLGLGGNWAESFSATMEPGAKPFPSRGPTSESDDDPARRDFAASGSNIFQRVRDNRRRSRSPEKKGKVKDAVAGLSYDYPPSAFPSYRQRVENLRLFNSRNKNQVRKGNVSPATPSSPLAMASEGKPTPRPSPIIDHHVKSPSVVSAESAAEDLQSEASSGVVSNAQSAIFMRGQVATGHYHAVNTRKPPMPGPPPSGALPSLPEGRDSNGPATPRISESSQKSNNHGVSPGKASIPPKSPKRKDKRVEYGFLPSDCSPLQTKQPASPPQTNGISGLEQVIPSSPTQIRVKSQGLAFPRPDQIPHSVSEGEFDHSQQQQQRYEKTAACKARDLARIRSQKAAIEDVYPNDVEQDGITMLPSVSDAYASNSLSTEHRMQASQTSDVGISSTLQHKRSDAPSRTRESSTPPPKLSPIIVVAEQEPISPISRMPSQRYHAIYGNNLNEEVLKSRFSRDSTEEPLKTFQTNGFHPGPAHPVSPALQLPEDESKRRPLSAHSMPASRPVVSRTPTPFTHSLLRAKSNHSSHQASTHESQVSELETRLSALEKKNVMLERAFLAVINTSAAYGGFGSGAAINLVDANGHISNHSDSWSGNDGNGGERSSGGSAAGSLYAGLEHLLAVHAGEAGKRLSTCSGPP